MVIKRTNSIAVDPDAYAVAENKICKPSPIESIFQHKSCLILPYINFQTLAIIHVVARVFVSIVELIFPHTSNNGKACENKCLALRFPNGRCIHGVAVIVYLSLDTL